MSWQQPPPPSGGLPLAGPGPMGQPPMGQGPMGQPPMGYGGDPRAAERQRLESETTNWIIVTAVGWFIGFMWLAGPAAWWKAGQIRSGYEAIQVEPPSNVNVLRLFGMITTITTLVIFAFACVGVAFFLLLGASHAHH